MSTLPYFQGNRRSEARVLEIGLSQTDPTVSYGIAHKLKSISSVLLYSRVVQLLFLIMRTHISSDPFFEFYDNIYIYIIRRMNSKVQQ